MLSGHCHCGAIRYEIHAEPKWTALCHCGDCRRHAGAPVVGWMAISEDGLKVIKGQPKVYRSSEHGRRHFCPDCGTGLFYFNAVHLPGIADVQIATLDDPDTVAPQIQVQTAERLAWMEGAQKLPTFERYPSKG
ncbi:MAG: GFA family protein [Steroidobacteraceae bacterium]